MRHIVLLILLACVCALCGAFAAEAEGPSNPTPTTETTATTTTPTQDTLTPQQVQRQINRYRHQTWHWQHVMGQPVTETLASPPADPIERLNTWKRVATRVVRIALRPPHEAAWQCIHHYEGAWNDTGAPYYGGLQMDLGFQRTYGGWLLAHKGTADHWTPLEQMWVAERALRAGRGFYPWPNTARYCGLI